MTGTSFASGSPAIENRSSLFVFVLPCSLCTGNAPSGLWICAKVNENFSTVTVKEKTTSLDLDAASFLLEHVRLALISLRGILRWQTKSGSKSRWSWMKSSSSAPNVA